MEHQKIILHVQGMHCRACVLLTESEARELPFITSAASDLGRHTLTLTGDFGTHAPQEIAQELTARLKPQGYTVSVEKQVHAAKWADFRLALPLALGFVALFLLLQKLGIVNLVHADKISYSTAFMVGIVASLSSCMAVVGGLVLSLSATFAKEGDTFRPQMLFHAGRLVSFFVLGGIIGALGSFFTLSAWTTFGISVVVAAVMLVLGINLLDVFPWSKHLQPSMPKFLARRAHGASKLDHALAPLLVGAATFFLPCGFTQAMQVYTLSTGSFTAGALTMGSFALGTLPVLGLISFGSFSIQNSKYSSASFKAAGIIVVLFALYNFANSLAAVGLIAPLFTM